MSQQLINAAANGNMPEVLRLLSQPNTNINFVGDGAVPSSSRTKVTALSVAIANRKWDMARFLIAQGANVSDPTCESYEYAAVFSAPYLVATTLDNMDASIFKLLLAKVQILNPSFSGWGHCTVARFLISQSKGNSHLGALLYHEAILRHDVRTIEELIASKLAFTINAQSFSDYLKTRTVTTQDAFFATKTINMLIDKNIILKSVGENIKTIVSKDVKFELKLDGFPEALKPHLQKPSQRSLVDLFCDLQAWLYPEERLPHVSVDSDLFRRMGNDSPGASAEAIRGRQNIIHLRSLLNLDQASILMRLNSCTSETGENPAALLLAEILLHHSDIKIQTETAKDGEPLLNVKQQSACLTVLNTLYSLTNLEKLLLGVSRQQSVSLAELSQQNAMLVDDVLTMKNTIDRMDRKMDIVVAALANNLASNDKPQPYDPRFTTTPRQS